MRLIDADALITELEKDESKWDKEAEDARNDPSYTAEYSAAMWSRANGIRDAIIEIYDAPSIGIVCCRECKWLDSGKNDSETWSMCTRHFGEYFNVNADDFCSYGCNCSEKPNNCEHITEDGVTCAKYPACDDCPDNPFNKVKGSERLVKGSEQTDCGWK